jgi:hypothetical protein
LETPTGSVAVPPLLHIPGAAVAQVAEGVDVLAEIPSLWFAVRYAN